MHKETVVITGAFGYTGRYVTKLLLNRGHTVRTLTNHPGYASEVARHYAGSA